MKYTLFLLLAGLWLLPRISHAQGVTTAGLSGFVYDEAGQPLPGANVIAVHQPSGTTYGAATRAGGAYAIPNMRVGGPYTITATFVSFQTHTEEDVFLSLGQTLRLDFALAEQAVELEGVEVTAEEDEVLNADRTGAATYVGAEQVAILPTVSRSTRDLTRLDPRSDGNFSFGGRNWLFNNVTLDGSYFNNPFGLDDPAPGGQAGAEPVPYDAIEQVQVSIAPFDVRQSGFTGASVNQVTKSGTNEFEGSAYTFYRDENLIGNTVSGNDVVANPELTFNQIGASLGGPIIRNRLFFFVNGELSRRDDPGTNFFADTDGTVGFGESRADAMTLQRISERLATVYDYDTGAFQDFLHSTDNNKFIAKLDWNVNERNNLSFRWNYLDSFRDLPPNAVAVTFNNTGRGPNAQSLPFQNSGYRINNELNSFALELNSRGSGFSNRFFASYNRFRDFREPLSEPFPTIEIGEDGVTFTTAGHEPFSIHNILDQDVFQVTNNFSFFLDRHVVTAGANFEYFSFFNSFNIFRHGLFQLPYFLDFEGDGIPNGSTFSTLDDFFAATNPDLPLCGPEDSVDGVLLPNVGSTCRVDLRGMITSDDLAFKGENIDVGQVGVYIQDEFLVSPQLTLTGGLRVDFPIYFTDPVANPFSTDLEALDENDQPVTVDQASLPGAMPLFSPRFGFNYDVFGDRTTQLRGGTGIFTGRIPFVWYGNAISNPGANPNLPGAIPFEDVPEELRTSDDSSLQTSFDLNALDEDFVFPQVWTTDFAVDHLLPGDVLGTLEVIYGKDINAIYMRNADLRAPTGSLMSIGSRPFFGELAPNEETGLSDIVVGSGELNPDGGAGIYVIDNTSEGYNFNLTAQLRKNFGVGEEGSLNTSLAYNYTRAENVLSTTEIAFALYQGNPIAADPNNPEPSFAQFGQPHRVVATATYRQAYGGRFATSLGLFATVARGNQFLVSGGNRYSFIYAGDVNGDGASNDLLYIPTGPDDINLADPGDWDALNALIQQDDYLSEHRGGIAERYGLVNPWYSNIDLRLLQDVQFQVGGRTNTVQLSLDVLNVANLLNSDWGVRQVANPAALSPLAPVGFDGSGEPVFDYVGPANGQTFLDDVSEFSRWRIQFGIRYLFGG
ncbi:MAG: TonB-dependent receptor [Rhodothermaceae bacterium]|nr:TonB-dependent receptor [Rhodothermaceae bacterium]